MQTWQVQDAKAKFSEFLDACLSEGPQVVTKRGVDAAVLISIDEWKRLQSVTRPTLKELLLSSDAPTDLLIPKRKISKRRQLNELE